MRENLLHERGAAISGALGALAAVIFGCGAYMLFLYPDGRLPHAKWILLLAGTMGVLGFFLASGLTLIRRAGIAHVLVGIFLSWCVMGFLGAAAQLEHSEIVLLIVVGSFGLVPAAIAGGLVRRAARRSAARPRRTGGRR